MEIIPEILTYHTEWNFLWETDYLILIPLLLKEANSKLALFSCVFSFLLYVNTYAYTPKM